MVKSLVDRCPVCAVEVDAGKLYCSITHRERAKKARQRSRRPRRTEQARQGASAARAAAGLVKGGRTVAELESALAEARQDLAHVGSQLAEVEAIMGERMDDLRLLSVWALMVAPRLRLVNWDSTPVGLIAHAHGDAAVGEHE